MREETLATILSERASAIIRTSDRQLADDAMQAAVRGGFRLVEFTLTTPGALELIHAFSKQPDLLVGAGTVMTPQQAEQARAAGARFLVSPICDPEIIAVAHKYDCVAIPGTATPTEMQAAHRAGAEFCKLFPAPANVAAFVKATLGPLPHLRIFPTNGVDLDNAADVLSAGAAGVGFVASLFEPEWMATGNLDAIEQRARDLLAQVKK